jgi:hypothetical protein
MGAILRALAARIKSLIVSLALSGYLPYSLAEWIIHRGGFRNE